MRHPKKNILVFVMNLKPRMVEDVRRYEAQHGQQYRILYLHDTRVRPPAQQPDADIYLRCDFSKPEAVQEALAPYTEELLAITCRSEAGLARFRELIPSLPHGLHTPSPDSLAWAADKYEMRKRLRRHDPARTPKFTRVRDGSAEERARIIKKVGFPLIVKPANLAASRFVTICYHEEELEKAIRTGFRRLRAAYERDHRREAPKMIAEEYMDGLMYSIDSYVDPEGGVTHCPLVRVKTGRDIGHDDFYNYLQLTPTSLKPSTIARAHAAAESAIEALALRGVSTHIELMKIDDEWRIIEVAARLGGFRDLLHSVSCGINHTMNDLAVRMPRKPAVPKTCKGYAAAIKWFAGKEGRITSLGGIKKLAQLDSFYDLAVNKRVGDRAAFARNGGRSIFNLFLYHSDRAQLLADIRRLEKFVHVKVKSKADVQRARAAHARTKNT